MIIIFASEFLLFLLDEFYCLHLMPLLIWFLTDCNQSRGKKSFFGWSHEVRRWKQFVAESRFDRDSIPPICVRFDVVLCMFAQFGSQCFFGVLVYKTQKDVSLSVSVCYWHVYEVKWNNIILLVSLKVYKNAALLMWVKEHSLVFVFDANKFAYRT